MQANSFADWVFSPLFYVVCFRYGPSGKAPLMKKFKKDLNTSTFMYQGRTVNASSHNTDHKKKNVSLKSLNIGQRNGSTEAMAKGEFKKVAPVLYSYTK